MIELPGVLTAHFSIDPPPERQAKPRAALYQVQLKPLKDTEAHGNITGGRFLWLSVWLCGTSVSAELLTFYYIQFRSLT